MYLNMNLLDLYRWENDTLLAFAVPHNPDDVVQAGDVLCIKEPFKRITITKTTTVGDEEKPQKILVAVRYCSDDKKQGLRKQNDGAPPSRCPILLFADMRLSQIPL